LSKKIKKLFLKIEYVSLDLEETLENFEEYNNDLNKNLQSEIEYMNFINKNSQNNNKEISSSPKPPESKLIRKIYKNLAKILHPDVSDNPNATEIFREVTDYYENYNLMGLIRVSNENNINLNFLNDADMQEIEESIQKNNEKINELKNTLAWFWGTNDAEVAEKRKKARSLMGINEKDFLNWKSG
jgi:hypothetical protein